MTIITIAVSTKYVYRILTVAVISGASGVGANASSNPFLHERITLHGSGGFRAAEVSHWLLMEHGNCNSFGCFHDSLNYLSVASIFLAGSRQMTVAPSDMWALARMLAIVCRGSWLRHKRKTLAWQRCEARPVYCRCWRGRGSAPTGSQVKQ